MVRTSLRSTIRRCSSQRTPSIRSSAAVAKIPMPFLQEHRLVIAKKSQDARKLLCLKPVIAGNRYIFEPDFGAASPLST